MSGFIDGEYSRWHCQEALGIDDDGKTSRCLRPATLRKFRGENVPMCDQCWNWWSARMMGDEKATEAQ